jgi:hypothetical protein
MSVISAFLWDEFRRNTVAVFGPVLVTAGWPLGH